jgi:hypothetical protein
MVPDPETEAPSLRTAFAFSEPSDPAISYHVTCAIQQKQPVHTSDRLSLPYKALTVSVNPRTTVHNLFRAAGKELLTQLVTDQQLDELDKACRVTVQNSGYFYWERDARIAVKKHNNIVRETVNYLNEKHRGQLKQDFGEYAKSGAHDLKEFLRPSLGPIAKKAEQLIADHLTRILRTAANEEIRKKQVRANGAYENPENICRLIFKGWRATTMPEPQIDGGIFATPAFYAQRIGTNTHLSGEASFLLTFGVDPYSYAVVLVARMEPLGKATLSRDIKVYALADGGGKKVVKRIDVAPDMDENQLEMAVLMAVGGIPSPSAARA